jgi:hypothetical protein
MKTSRCFAIALAVLLAALVVCLACAIAARLWLSRGVGATFVAPSPSATSLTAEVRPFTPTPTATPLSSSDPTPTGVATPGATSVVITDPSLTDRGSLERQLQAAQQGQQLAVLVHDDHVSREIAAYLATQPEAVYRNVTVRFTPGLVELEGEVEIAGLWVPATVRGQAGARDCQPEVTITELEVGGFLTPDWARDYVASLVYDVLDRYPDDAPVCLERVEVRQGEALLEGTKR